MILLGWLVPTVPDELTRYCKTQAQRQGEASGRLCNSNNGKLQRSVAFVADVWLRRRQLVAANGWQVTRTQSNTKNHYEALPGVLLVLLVLLLLGLGHTRSKSVVLRTCG